jgi:hypothetical protein
MRGSGKPCANRTTSWNDIRERPIFGRAPFFGNRCCMLAVLRTRRYRNRDAMPRRVFPDRFPHRSTSFYALSESWLSAPYWWQGPVASMIVEAQKGVTITHVNNFGDCMQRYFHAASHKRIFSIRKLPCTKRACCLRQCRKRAIRGRAWFLHGKYCGELKRWCGTQQKPDMEIRFGMHVFSVVFRLFPGNELVDRQQEECSHTDHENLFSVVEFIFSEVP